MHSTIPKYKTYSTLCRVSYRMKQKLYILEPNELHGSLLGVALATKSRYSVALRCNLSCQTLHVWSETK